VRVIVCGTRYGSAYLQAVKPLWGHDAGLRLVGIVALGSDRSRELAARYGVPLYRAEREVPRGGVDLVCVAVPGPAGTQLAVDFLRRGVHVLAEHPAEPADLSAALAEARSRGLVYHLNAHFADLETVWPFFAVCARATERPLFLTATTNPRTLYSCLDLVGRALGGLSPFAVHGALAGAGPLAAVHGSAAGVPFSIQCQTALTERDDGRETWVSHRVALTWETGTLHLVEAAGPVLWVPVAGPVQELPPPEAAAIFAKPAWSLLSPPQSPTLLEHLADHRDRANRLALRRLAAEVRTGHRAPEQAPEHLLSVSHAWRQVCDGAGLRDVPGRRQRSERGDQART
jgi:thiazolinyl imide reductase